MLSHAGYFDNTMADFIYAECKTNKWYGYGETNAHWTPVSATKLRTVEQNNLVLKSD